eukprot:CAMPEP_0197633372 /NCGR_PEP_ID=MMETSP1338-20131121/9756_1 /TAXON_ID=43686 ORGANISM="Pelagodinium beii, Strain RCC1491" /NCGR_SAMPLE_ID=MMETSP1338 /ASSEMBLY_ACC=CAM_ASM_000754 /LENGTH=79 /DNA_ID=CAMNT_0043205025 /DNA_START=49 /DNA_END=284 /DNA_ORIENTATION=-
MKLFVRDVAGRTLGGDAAPEADIASVQAQLAAEHGIDGEQRLIFGGRSLQAAELLSECGIADESTLFLNLELQGGGKKR